MTVTSTAPQSFYCSTPGHCENGMYGVINPAYVVVPIPTLPFKANITHRFQWRKYSRRLREAGVKGLRQQGSFQGQGRQFQLDQVERSIEEGVLYHYW